MNEFLINFHFLRPLWLLLLLLPVIGYKHFFSKLKTSSSWEGVCDANLLDYLLVKGSSRQRSFISYIGLVGFVAAVIAVAGPVWHKKELPVYAPENPVMLLLNLSSDMDNKDVTPNRLARAKFAISDMVELMGNTQVGLVVYTSEPYLITPFTEDNKIVSNLLRAANGDIMPENGDKLGRAIDFAVEKMKNSKYAKGDIVIFSADVGQEFNAAMKSAQLAADEGYNVHVAEINSETSDKLKMVADKGNGVYVRAGQNTQAVARIANRINSEQSQDLKLSQNQQEMWLDYGWYLVIIPLICCLYFFRRGILVLVFMILFSNQAEAGFFLNSNQEGLKAFEEEDYVTSVEKFTDSQWKGAAYYRMGYYDKAYKFYSEKNDVESLYNQGNALAKGGKIEEAIAKYEEVLAIIPEHEDAKFNLEYLKQQQDQNQQNQDNQDENDDKEDKDSEQNQDSNPDENEDEQNSSEQEQEQNQNQSGDDEQEQEENSQQKQSSEDNEDGESNDDDGKEEQDQAPTPNEQTEKDENSATADMEESSDDPKYDEEVQAREQQYRDIPEDVGGLLREFIKKEYKKNRYKEAWR